MQSSYDVEKVKIYHRSKLVLPWTYFWSFWKICFLLIRSKFILVQGGGYHSLIAVIAAKIARRPCYIVAIGTDCIRLPEINYGHFCKPLLRWATTFSYRFATHIFPKHTSLIYHEYRLEYVQYQNQGIKAFVPKLKTPITAIENGYDHDFWTDYKKERKPYSMLTVASNVRSKKRFLVKGIDLFLRIAKELPKYSFTIVGDFDSEVVLPKNVKIFRELSREELSDLYNSHMYYLQLSRSEGFPNSLCESMLCGCVPIVTDVGGQSDIVSDTGLKLRSNNVASMKKAIEHFVTENSDYRSEVRNVIKNNFTLENRKKKLLNSIKAYMAD